MHLVKYLAQAGIASRRASEELVRVGRVTINGSVVREPAALVQEGDGVSVDGVLLTAEPKKYFMLHKPPGVISTARDTHRRRTVTDLVPGEHRLYPVGRLDAETTGLILVTNDGDLANRLIHPRYEIPKTYVAKVHGNPDAEALHRLRTGVDIGEIVTSPADVKVLRDGRSTELELTIHEGKKRQVRRMMQVVGYPVAGLRRVAFGPLKLGSLPEGEHRPLTETELDSLRKAARIP